jgi:hypothetical protein
MNADIQGALNQINQSYKAFVHRDKPMTRKEVEAVLKYALAKGYKTTDELSDEEVDKILKQISK